MQSHKRVQQSCFPQRKLQKERIIISPPRRPHELKGEPPYPVEDLDEGDDGDAGEEAEGAADGADLVEDVGPELQVDLGDDGGVEEEVQNGDVLPVTKQRERNSHCSLNFKSCYKNIAVL